MAQPLKHWNNNSDEWTRKTTLVPEPPEAVVEAERRLIELCDWCKENGITMTTDPSAWIQPSKVKFKFRDLKKV